ncbi:MAG: helix-turn-helix transcriptional regulator [Anaerolineae bacterium]|nr:helix-turn-helix transcriptional regulator [Anaerolineae bacterium]MCI0608452.1 helix-turn-helix transcriptional regulator [Anaerolineae bacterium]
MPPVLTDREKQVLKLIADGLTNKEISSSLSIKESTVENHIHHIYKKLKISNRAHAVAYALQSRIDLQKNQMENRGNPS